MKQIKKVSIIVFATCLILSGFVSTAHADWSSWSTIQSILLHHTSLEITLDGNEGCDKVFRLYFSYSRNHDVKASALLSAYYEGHEVSVEYVVLEPEEIERCTTKLLRFKVRP